MYQFHSFNYIHCPNANEQEIKREFNILHEYQVLTPENKLNTQEINQIIKHKSFWGRRKNRLIIKKLNCFI